MIKHTPEPWKYDGDDDGDVVVWGASPNDDFIGNVGVPIKQMGVIIDLDLANARRIVACVNACAGVHDNYLSAVTEEGGAAKFFEEREQFKSQRDELLEALKYHQDQTRPIQQSIDVIAKCEAKS